MQLTLQENRPKILDPLSYLRPLLGFAFTNADTQKYIAINPFNFFSPIGEKKCWHDSANTWLAASWKAFTVQ